jgi:ring-1,2-phenylacetyl-CoA epoxidase subunit PaaC
MALPTSEVAALPTLEVVADACLIASHRLTQWVSNAPTMEEDVAIANIALDLLGQSRGLLSHLGDEDQLAYFRDASDFHHPVICELPNGDFAHTMLRQLFLDCWLRQVWDAFASNESSAVRGVAEKAIKENRYHLRHSSAWVVRLGDGTDESHRRMNAALDQLWPYCAPIAIHGWHDAVVPVLVEATLPIPRLDGVEPIVHTGHLSELLDEMQSLARAHPGASW